METGTKFTSSNTEVKKDVIYFLTLRNVFNFNTFQLISIEN